MRKNLLTLFAIVLVALVACQPQQKKTEKKEPVSTRWTDAQAQQWAAENGWLRGSNFNPSTAINQLET